MSRDMGSPREVKRRKVSKSNSSSSKFPPECMFCGSEEDNEDLLGKRIQSSGLTVHYFCMLLSSGLCQRGSDKEGILGFMPKDIRAEVNRGRKLSCNFCKQKGATIGCTTKACRSSFHLICGRRHGTMHQFFGNFGSFCPTHRPAQATLTSDRLAFFGTANTTCAICICTVEARASNETLRSPCCRSSWFHRDCIQRLATTAGLHFFKCPLCNNKEMFQEEMLEFGIYIPDQDAAWEMEPNAYQELLERYSKCDAQKCICPKGREYNKDASKWEIALCICCGSQGVHVKCQGLASIDEDWMCPNCDDIAKRVPSSPKKRSRPAKKTNYKSVREELRKDYEKLHEKATANRPDCKTLNKDSPECNTPGTSGLQSPSLNRSHHTPLVKNYAETVVRITPREDSEDGYINVTSSDDDDAVEGVKPRKSKTKAKRRLGVPYAHARSSPQSFTSTHISPKQAFPLGELTVRIRPINLLPGESVSLSDLERTGILTGKQKYCPPLHKRQRPRQKLGESSQQNNHVTQEDRVNSSSGERRESFTNLPSASVSAPALSNCKRDSYRFSPYILEHIKAPETFTPRTVEITDDCEVSCDEEVSFKQQCSPGKCGDNGRKSGCQDSKSSGVSTLALDDVGCSSQSQKSQDIIEIPTQGRSVIPQRSPGKCEDIQKRSQAESVFGREAQLAVDDVDSNAQSQQIQNSLDLKHYRSLMDYRFNRLTRQSAKAVDNTDITIHSVERDIEIGRPQQVPQVSSTIPGDPNQILPLFNNSIYRSMKPNQDPECIDLDSVDSYGITQTSHSISRSSSSTDDIQLISSASDPNSDEEVIFLRSEKPHPSHQLNGHKRQWLTQQPLPQFPAGVHITHTATSTLCANPNTGQILMRTQTDQIAMPAHISKVALGTSANDITEELVSRPSSNTRSQQNAVVIDLTDSFVSEETECLESTSNAPVTAKETCPPFLLRPASPIQLNNISGFKKAVSPLKICEGTLQSLRSAVTSNKMQASQGTQTCSNTSIIDLSNTSDDWPETVSSSALPPGQNQRINKLTLKRNRDRYIIL